MADAVLLDLLHPLESFDIDVVKPMAGADLQSQLDPQLGPGYNPVQKLQSLLLVFGIGIMTGVQFDDVGPRFPGRTDLFRVGVYEQADGHSALMQPSDGFF